MFQRHLYSVLLILTLLFSNIGLAVNIHYCGNSIESIELGYASDIACAETSHEKSCCKEKAEIKKKDCCKDETIKQSTDNVVVKISSSQLQTAFVAPEILRFQPLVVTEVKLPKKLNIAFYFNSNAPPLYKLYSQYLLYA